MTYTFLPIELQNLIISYTRPVYPYIEELKIDIRIFEAKNEKYKLEHNEESGLTFINYIVFNLNKKHPNYAIIEITHMTDNYLSTEYYESLENNGVLTTNLEEEPEAHFLEVFSYMIMDNRNNNNGRYNHFDYDCFIYDFDNYNSSDSDSDSDSDNDSDSD